jgi:tetratricopeptide (TPR) repeat protein/SAM-dependent methyltransferase
MPPVNRKERRAARKQGKGGFGPAQRAGAGAVSADLFASALAQYRAGRLDETERLCRDVLMFDRGHFDALHLLGIVAAQVGNLDAAIDLFDRALGVNERHPECHFNMAHVLRACGRHRDAIHHLTQATVLRRDYAAAHIALADMLAAQNELDEARARYEGILAVDPHLVDAHHGLAHVAMRQGRLDEAAERFRRVVTLKPDYAEAFSNLGMVLAAQGQWDGAVAHYRQALTLKPGLVDVYRNLARALLMQGETAEALTVVRQGLAIGETEEARALFVQCIKSAPVETLDEDLRRLAARAMAEGWSRPSELSETAVQLFKRGAAGGAWMARMRDPGSMRISPADLLAADGLASMSADPLLRALMESAPIPDVELERLLTAIRSALLLLADEAAPDGTIGPEDFAFGCALARQCFINEYVFSDSDEDRANVGRLQTRLADALAIEAPVSPLWPMALACFEPLHRLHGAARLLQRPWPDALRAVFDQQIGEPLVERELRASIPALTAIEDPVSRKVRDQYEEMPYPRWVKTAGAGQPSRLDWYLRSQFPWAPIQQSQSYDGLDVLIAGCGTGQHAIETAQRFAGARVLAIDLSLSSLSYAKRKTRELGLRNIEYAQADILALGSLDARFDLIEASGVLHHLRDPMQGWRVLVSLLRPGGVMHIGLYSALARADIRAARDFIAARGYQHDAAGIRRCRHDLLAQEDGSLFNVTRYRDFFTTSECRDLLFHAQENQLTIPEIKTFLLESGLSFIGFSGPAPLQYRACYSDDGAMTDLDRWHLFELENPLAFVNMYQFWVQKAGQVFTA